MHLSHFNWHSFFSISLLCVLANPALVYCVHSGPLGKVRPAAATVETSSTSDVSQDNELRGLTCEERVNLEVQLALLKYKNSDEFKKAMADAVETYKKTRSFFPDDLGFAAIVGVGGAIVGGGVVGCALLFSMLNNW